MKKIITLTSSIGSLIALAPAAKAQTDLTTTTTAIDTTAGAGLAIGTMILFGVFSILGLALFVFWIFMLIDVFKRTNWKQPNDKVVWIVVVILLGYLGAIIYYFAVKRALGKDGNAGPTPGPTQGPTNTPPVNNPPTNNTPPPAAPMQ